MGLELDPETVETQTKTAQVGCPLNGCNKSYKTVGWWKSHEKSATAMRGSRKSAGSLDMEVASTVRSDAQTSSEITVDDSSQVFQCPKCARHQSRRA